MLVRMARAVAMAGLVSLTVLAVPAQPASAHPFGPPLTAKVTADGSDLLLTWNGARDDWSALGRVSGATTEPTGGAEELELLSSSPKVPAYLGRTIRVEQDGKACRPKSEGIADLLGEGARLRYTCPAPVESVSMTVTALAEVNSAYRTVVTAGTSQQLFTSTKPTQQVTISDHASGPGSTPLLAAGGTVAVGAGVLALLVTRRRRSVAA